MSWSAFSIFQQGCPPIFTHSFLQRWSVTAIWPSSTRPPYDTPVRAIVLDRDGRPALAELPAPEPSLEVLACGLCGSDVEKLVRAPAGTVLGHEVVVRTAAGTREALVHHRP